MKISFVVPALCALLISAEPLQAQTAPAAPNRATAVDTSAMLARYQLALDQISSGNLSTARVVLEEGIRRFGPQNDLNLLLGYVLQREGKSAAAQEQLAKAPASPLAGAFAAQLRGSAGNPVVSATPGNIPATATLPAANNSAPSSALSQSDARLARLEEEMVAMVNEERVKAGLRALASHGKLADVARAHSAEMRDKNYFAHESPTARLNEPMDRYQSAFNERPRIIAENIFRSWGSQRQVTISEIKEGHVALLKSPGHRANIMFPDVTHIGIGIVSNSRGDIWITQMFLRP